MKIFLCQNDIAWNDVDANLRQLEESLLVYGEESDLYIMPEMFLTGFSMHPESSAIREESEPISYLKLLCKKHNVAILGSLAIEDDGKYYNRALFITEEGIKARYDKEYLFTPSGESNKYESKYPPCIFEYRGWKIMPKICYDLRFPENVRNLDIPDIIVYMANWPIDRIHHWELLLRSRAIENQCYVLGVNRLGKDGNAWKYNGKSMYVKPNGAGIVFMDTGEPMVIELYKDVISRNRNEFPFYKDKK